VYCHHRLEAKTGSKKRGEGQQRNGLKLCKGGWTLHKLDASEDKRGTAMKNPNTHKNRKKVGVFLAGATVTEGDMKGERRIKLKGRPSK